MLIEKKSCGTILKINTFENILNIETVNKIDKKLLEFENKYSRFFLDNYLNKLNKSGKSEIDEEFKTIFAVCKKLNKITNGYFDITVLPFLENFGYGIEKEKLEQNFGMENIEIIENNIILHNKIKIDLGSIGKGYIVDYIYHILKNQMNDFTIDFGGDIKVGTKKEVIGLEDPFNDKKIIGEIVISNESICSSNGQKRNFGDKHHLINPITKTSQNDKIAIYVKHKSATLADGYSTALFVSPINLSLEILEKTKGLEAMIISDKGEIYKTAGFDAKLY